MLHEPGFFYLSYYALIKAALSLVLEAAGLGENTSENRRRTFVNPTDQNVLYFLFMTTTAIDMATSRMEERAEGQHGRIWAALDRGWLPAAVLAHLARVYWRSPLLLTELFGTRLHAWLQGIAFGCLFRGIINVIKKQV